MEFSIIVCSSTLEEEILQFFKKNMMFGYTVISSVYGSGEGGGTRLGNDIWPGQNTVYFLCATSEQMRKFIDWSKEYKRQELREGLKVFNLALKEVI